MHLSNVTIKMLNSCISGKFLLFCKSLYMALFYIVQKYLNKKNKGFGCFFLMCLTDDALGDLH